ncbi:MAG: hypothetical protein A2857_01710 [Candidatus Levybacteria bacterium RIFCSPHIGHO2_01_FULL_36_15]|nr:MAG: hypothetical protein A2857_01710 [Candidatus Levybacteria bacterium RIFCSPHIGHO2_01_FULL_36_15]OGH38013.1 MAG: hypothetical protein A2905_05880 [Candidatus Levybacteria bacterium RIFCSPLOWO2_01_FULL_36_10]
MEPTANSEYLNLFSELIKKQIVVLGPDITLAKVRSVGGITIDTAGNVTRIEGDPKALLSKLINQFIELSGMIVKRTMESMLLSYSSLTSAGSLGNAANAGTGKNSSDAKLPPDFSATPVDLSNPLGGLDENKIAELSKMLEGLDKQEETSGA